MSTMSVQTVTTMPRPLPRANSVVGRFVGALLVWQARSRERQILAAMDDHALKDIGLTRADVSREIEKPFWRA